GQPQRYFHHDHCLLRRHPEHRCDRGPEHHLRFRPVDLPDRLQDRHLHCQPGGYHHLRGPNHAYNQSGDWYARRGLWHPASRRLHQGLRPLLFHWRSPVSSFPVQLTALAEAPSPRASATHHSPETPAPPATLSSPAAHDYSIVALNCQTSFWSFPI